MRLLVLAIAVQSTAAGFVGGQLGLGARQGTPALQQSLSEVRFSRKEALMVPLAALALSGGALPASAKKAKDAPPFGIITVVDKNPPKVDPILVKAGLKKQQAMKDAAAKLAAPRVRGKK
jgi:hypothetical protein